MGQSSEGGGREETEFETARENRGVYSVQRAQNFVEGLGKHQRGVYQVAQNVGT
jgi:hypothetical protein